MGKFNQYGKTVDTAVREVFAKYLEAEEKLGEAQKMVREHPMPQSSWKTAGQMAEAAEALAALERAKEEVKRIKDEDFYRVEKLIQATRADLEAAVNEEYAMKVSEVDKDTLELLGSGVCRPSDFMRMYNEAETAGNYTMQRRIAALAEDAARAREKDHLPDDEGSLMLRAVAAKGKIDRTVEPLRMFDGIAYAFERSCDNTAMVKDWDTITADTIEAL